MPPKKKSKPAPETKLAQDRFINRDLSWLEFNARVLNIALDDRTALLERVRFLAIFASNLDEFVMKRIGLLKHRHTQGVAHAPTRPGELPPIQTLNACRTRIAELESQLSNCWQEDLIPALHSHHIRIITYKDLTKKQAKAVASWYRANVFPILTPLAVDPGHRFPFISNLSENLGILLESTNPDEPNQTRFARLKIPDILPGYTRVDTLAAADDEDDTPPTEESPAIYIALDEIITHNLDDLFPGMRIVDILPFRVTRSAAVELDDEEIEDLLEHVEEELRARRFADAIRIETPPDPSPEILRFLLNELGLTAQDHSAHKPPLAFADLFTIADMDRPELKDTVWRPVRPPALADPETNIFAQIRSGDLLVHHPYESFTDSVERFIHDAAHDPDVLAIKQTLYRTSRDSPFVGSLIHAAEEGKQVACLVELRARFDEEKNVTFARQLEAAGVHVAYGVLGLKTHSKCSMVVRREKIDGSWGIRTYAHLGTGNYHPQTAQLYTDLGLFTCDPEITADVVRLFNMITGLSAGQEYNQLLVAPDHMRNRYIDFIEREIDNAKANKPARIIAKMNALEDRMITEALYRASNAGVKIDLIVRGFCCLRPGVKGMSANITVRSIIGRFLEHSRVFVFANGSDNPQEYTYYFGSADWMYRNLSARVEAACPVHSPEAKARLWRMLDVMLQDRRKASVLNPDGSYTQLTAAPTDDPTSPAVLGTFETLMRDALPPTDENRANA